MQYNTKVFANLIQSVPLNPSAFVSSITLHLKKHPALALLVPYCMLLIFLGLGDSVLQVDEGGDTFVSTTILKYGVPMHSDGVNATMLFADIYDGLFIYRTWVPYYLQALSLAIFGNTSFAARLPFALVGIASVIALYFLTLELTRNKITAFLSAFFLASSVPALLYFRTARYVGLPILLTIVLIYFYFRIFKGKKWQPAPFIITAVLLFHSMYVAFAGLIAGILIHFLLHRNRITPQNARQVPKCALVIGIFTLPWLAAIYPVFSHITQFYADVSDLVDNSFLGFFKHFAGFLFQLNNYIFPFILLPFLFVAKLKVFNLQIQLLGICIVTLLLATSVHPIPLQQYVAAALPLFYILLALIVTECFSGKIWLSSSLAGILVFTNLIHIGPLLPLKPLIQGQSKWFDENPYRKYAAQTFNREIRPASVLSQHLYQITHPYQGPLDHIVDFFKTHGDSSQSCYIDNEAESLAFYTGMKLIPKEALHAANPPDWIVLRGDQRHLNRADDISKKLKTIIQSPLYREITLDAPAWRINNSYDIQLHKFRSPDFADRVHIYQRISKPVNL